MAEDRSLDEFLDAGDPDEDDDSDPAEGGDPDSAEGESDDEADAPESDQRAGQPGGETDGSEDAGRAQSVDPATVDPATTTYSWEPAGGACGVCGEHVDRRWESEDGLVCQACKEW